MNTSSEIQSATHYAELEVQQDREPARQSPANMTTTFLTNELTNLVSEAKRKNTELRNAAEKSLQELKSLPATSEQQLAAGKKRGCVVRMRKRC